LGSRRNLKRGRQHLLGGSALARVGWLADIGVRVPDTHKVVRPTHTTTKGESMKGICEGCYDHSIIKQDKWGNWNCELCDPKLFEEEAKLVNRNGKVYMTGSVINEML